MNNNSALKQHYPQIAYNFRRLRFANRQTQDTISNLTGLGIQELTSLENEIRCSLNTVLVLCTHFGVNLDEFTKEKQFPEKYLNSLKKQGYIRVSEIPEDLHSSFLNFFCGEKSVGAASYFKWLNYLNFKRSVSLISRKGLIKRINKLGIGDCLIYAKRYHSFVFEYINENSIVVEITKAEKGYIITKI